MDVEVQARVESIHSLLYARKILEDERTLSDYNIQKWSRIVATSGLAGEGKRGRVDEEQTTPRGKDGGNIVDMSAFTMEMKMGVEKVEFIYTKWVEDLSIDEHETLKEIVLSNPNYLTSDNTIRKYAPLVVVYAELEAQHLKLWTIIRIWVWGLF